MQVKTITYQRVKTLRNHESGRLEMCVEEDVTEAIATVKDTVHNDEDDYLDISTLEAVLHFLNYIEHLSYCRTKKALSKEIKRFIRDEIKASKEWNNRNIR